MKCRQPHPEFELVLPCPFPIDLVSYPAQAEGLVNITLLNITITLWIFPYVEIIIHGSADGSPKFEIVAI